MFNMQVDYTIMSGNEELIAVSDDAYFRDYGPDEGEGPNYEKIAEAMIAIGAVHVCGCLFNLNGHSEFEIVNGMESCGFEMAMDEDFCECMGEFDLDEYLESGLAEDA